MAFIPGSEFLFLAAWYWDHGSNNSKSSSQEISSFTDCSNQNFKVFSSSRFTLQGGAKRSFWYALCGIPLENLENVDLAFWSMPSFARIINTSFFYTVGRNTLIA